MKAFLSMSLVGIVIFAQWSPPPSAVGQELTVSSKPPGLSGPSSTQSPDHKYEYFNKVMEGAKEYEGLFRFYLKENRLYAEIQSSQFERSYLLPMAIARGMGLGGYTLNFDEQWVVFFRR